MMGVLLHVPNYIMGVHIHSLHFKAPPAQKEDIKVRHVSGCDS
jgi:hypothetical protein